MPRGFSWYLSCLLFSEIHEFVVRYPSLILWNVQPLFLQMSSALFSFLILPVFQLHICCSWYSVLCIFFHLFSLYISVWEVYVDISLVSLILSLVMPSLLMTPFLYFFFSPSIYFLFFLRGSSLCLHACQFLNFTYLHLSIRTLNILIIVILNPLSDNFRICVYLSLVLIVALSLDTVLFSIPCHFSVKSWAWCIM